MGRGGRGRFERGADRLDSLGPGSGVRLTGHTSRSAWLHHPLVVPVLGWPGFLIWRIFFPLSVDVEGWTAGGSVRGGGEGLMWGVLRTWEEQERAGEACLYRFHV